jgi:hypothetical protein
MLPLFDSSGEVPVKWQLSQLIREDTNVRVGLEDAADSPLFLSFYEDIPVKACKAWDDLYCSETEYFWCSSHVF